MPFFSIIIPTYNREKFLKIALNSVFYQSFSDFELIVIDDGSTDNTARVVQSIKDSRLHYHVYEHAGVSAARNIGITRAQGEFICFLDSDDRFRKEKLEVTHYYIKKMPEYKIFHTDEIWYRSHQLLPQKIYHAKPTGFVFENALKLCCVSISTVAIKKDVFNAIGTFDESMPVCEDYDFWLRVTAQFLIYLIPYHLTIKEGGHPDQQSFKYPAMDKFRIYAIEKILKNGTLSDKQRKLAVEELKNKCSIYIQGARKRKKMDDVAHFTKLVDSFKNV
jgi:glycosyltransferase involved in cell wall biosynthesis